MLKRSLTSPRVPICRKKYFFSLQYRISEWALMSISEHFRYRNDFFQSDIFLSDIGITDVDVGCWISPILRSMSIPTYVCTVKLCEIVTMCIVQRVYVYSTNTRQCVTPRLYIDSPVMPVAVGLSCLERVWNLGGVGSLTAVPVVCVPSQLLTAVLKLYEKFFSWFFF